MNEQIKYLCDQAKVIRKDIVEMVYLAKDGHPGPALSITDIVASLYFNLMKLDPQNPDWPERDRLILSKGHACPAVYSALAKKGYYSEEILPTLRAFDSKLQGHPVVNKTPGIDMTSGSLGNGLSIGVGMALAANCTGTDYNVYVIMGDGELQEGIVWEGMMTATKYKLGKLIVFVDHNGWQSGDSVECISGLLPIYQKFESFGWHCQEIDGHDIESILGAVNTAKKEENRPSMILCRTIKGKGVPFMENDNSWHKRVPTKEQYEEAMKILGV
ncbi:transketolase [Petroclostridium sp. X23]|uniref:transketolase n=1 Tax=Petroclostridium sp. X23 TaxID=3045146 RepID=UPI0024AD04D6|nr:transketolase [Petroclostridium sp. X23]WHH59379.1 transketolase [Petroclostridium sp. X23]